MSFEQDWIRETVIRRFDKLTGRAERLEDVARLQADAIEKRLKGALDCTNQQCLTDLLAYPRSIAPCKPQGDLTVFRHPIVAEQEINEMLYRVG